MTAVLRAAASIETNKPSRTHTPVCHTPSVPSPAPLPTTVKLYPDVAIGMLRQEEVAVGRIWLLLRALDSAGRGWLEETAVRRQLTRKQSELQVCGWRHLRNLLNRGEGRFWQRQNGRIWLRSLPKVAHALGVTCLTTRPVRLPVAVLTQSIGQVRAHLYASFHSGRGRPDRPANPIARETIAAVTTVRPRIQRLYEKRARVRRRRNFGVGAPATETGRQEQAWQRGNALFELTDNNGVQGRPGETYLAWQLPNSYVGPHQPYSEAHHKHLHQELVDLSLQGTTGNGRSSANDAPETQVECGKRYCENGRVAAKLANRQKAPELYWPASRRHTRAAIWHVLE